MDWETSFDDYLEHLCNAIGHSDRCAGLVGYCRGLMLPIARKSVEPLAAHIEPHRVSARHQSLHHFVSKSEWSDAALTEQIRRWVLPHMDPANGLYWIIDDTGFPKKGKHSVGVARQYCGQLGKQDNCQVAVSLSVATEEASLPVAWRLYLPQEWAEDPTRRQQAGVPEEIRFATKPQISITQLREARQSGAPNGVVLADAGYGNDTAFRDAVGELGLQYAVGIQSSTRVWPPGLAPLPAETSAGKAGRPRSLQRRVPGHDPVPVKDLALALESSCYRTISWREGTRTALTSRFAALRVRASHRDYWRATPRDEEWLLIEWPVGDPEPSKYWLCTLPEDTPVERLVHVAKMRWRIERDYQDLKQEFGLGHFEGRGWRGFHHHATLCIAAYGFLVARRLSEGGKKNSEIRGAPALPENYIPRGSPAHAATRT
ncbi:MAG TPA: IS701 family transposase [Paraburkholderia sp.]|uniref:IS701 family transposase n=1 Tax=Paraburkholderia sp. TaxID=1926495 RepID=UPI002B487327|nr:IS701 family transposase [Paraburkholderia sp.]HKR43426.1 IS701 family transposase [Paraburkholderia sp.]